MSEVLLICMPFFSSRSPNLGISLLQGALKQRGITCDIRYLQLPYAAEAGFDLYRQVTGSFPSVLLGEWLFAEPLFGGQLPEAQEYIDIVLRKYVTKHGRMFPERLIAQLQRLRKLSAPYLDACMGAIPWERYSVIGFTSTFSQNLPSLALARRIKDEYPEATIVFGGANCEGEMGIELHRQFPWVDYVCCGESDWLFPELVARLGAGREVENLPGLIYRQNGETIVYGGHTPPILDLDALPIPGFDDYFIQLEEVGSGINPEDIRLMIETSRGCWWGTKSQCTFCGLNANTLNYRSKSSQRVVEEFSYLAERYPTVKIVDVTDNILDMRYFKDVIPALIERDLNLFIFYETKSNLRKEQIIQLKQAGVIAIQPGIESLDSDVLRLMKKGCTAIQNLQTLKWTREIGISVSWNLITGIPGEDPASYNRMAEMIPALVHLQPPNSRGVSQVRLDRFSPYFREPETYGMVNLRSAAAYRFVYPFPEENLARLAYYFDFDYADGRQPERYTQPLNQAIEIWYDRSHDGTLISLTSDGRLNLYDTRPSAKQREMVLEGAAKVIYEYCDQGRTLPSIMQHLIKKKEAFTSSTDRNSVMKLLDSWIQARVMVQADNRYLSLAIPLSEPAQGFIDSFVAELSGFAHKEER